MEDNLGERIDAWLGGKGVSPLPADTTTALLEWLNDVGLTDAGKWLDEPNNDFNSGYACAILSLCASLPGKLIAQLQPRRQETLEKLQALVQFIDQEQGNP